MNLKRRYHCNKEIVAGYVVASLLLGAGIFLNSAKSLVGDVGWFGYIPVGVGAAMMIALRLYMVKKIKEKEHQVTIGPGGVVTNLSTTPFNG